MQEGRTIKSTYAGWPIATARLMGLTANLQMNLPMPPNIKARETVDEGIKHSETATAHRPQELGVESTCTLLSFDG